MNENKDKRCSEALSTWNCFGFVVFGFFSIGWLVFLMGCWVFFFYFTLFISCEDANRFKESVHSVYIGLVPNG